MTLFVRNKFIQSLNISTNCSRTSCCGTMLCNIGTFLVVSEAPNKSIRYLKVPLGSQTQIMSISYGLGN